MSLDGKVAIVTGSGRGLGLAYAQELARQGAAVVVNDVDEQTAADAVASIEAEGGKAVAVVAPVGPTETAKQLVQTAVDTFGRRARTGFLCGIRAAPGCLAPCRVPSPGS